MSDIDIEAIKANIDSEIAKITSSQELEEVRLKYLGRKGILSQLTGTIPNLPPQERGAFGQKVNGLKNQISSLIQEKQEALSYGSGATKKIPAVDIGMPGIAQELGRLHPITKTISEICGIFTRMGFSADFIPKTIVLQTGEAVPHGFEPIRFDFDSSNVDVKTMVNMHLLQVFTAIFAYEKRINFVTQPDVELYKMEMNLIDPQKISSNEQVTPTELLVKIRDHIQLKPKTRFLEGICYWHLKDEFKNLLRKLLKNAFPQLETLVFTGSDWNHHSYQAASRNEDTLFIILTKSIYEHHIDGVSELMLMNNIETIQKIAYATHQTLYYKALLFKVNEEAFIP